MMDAADVEEHETVSVATGQRFGEGGEDGVLRTMPTVLQVLLLSNTLMMRSGSSDRSNWEGFLLAITI